MSSEVVFCQIGMYVFVYICKAFYCIIFYCTEMMNEREEKRIPPVCFVLCSLLYHRLYVNSPSNSDRDLLASLLPYLRCLPYM